MNSVSTTIADAIWRKDSSLWSDDPGVQESINDRLGWLDAPYWIQSQLDNLTVWCQRIHQTMDFDHVVLLGMGGSSLAPLVISESLPSENCHAELKVLDSTHPEMVDQIVQLGVERCLFVVASKSGTTLETSTLYKYFFSLVGASSSNPGQRFVAITDDQSWLHREAEQQGFLRIFINPSDIGGRFSALSFFGAIPCMLCGFELEALVRSSVDMANRTKALDDSVDSALALGHFMAEQFAAGRDKMTLRFDGALDSLGTWIEQLVAESTGKAGVGILPVIYASEQSRHLRSDEFQVHIVGADVNLNTEPHTLSLKVDNPSDIGAEFFRWEFATAVCAYRMGINPFDEPNVSEAKLSTGTFISGNGALDLMSIVSTPTLEVEMPGATFQGVDQLSGFWNHPGSQYMAVLAYLPIEQTIQAALSRLQSELVHQFAMPCTIGFGPRYLHSTGQLHKGGAATGVFLQIIEQSDLDFSVPSETYSFASLIQAQADGDLAVLQNKGLPVMRIRLKGDRLQGIRDFSNLVGLGQ